MENIIKEYKERFGKEHSMRRRYACMLGVLALLVCLAVFWRLKLVGTAMTNEASCGLQEHTHTDACYTEELICGIATGETAEGADHVHTADCYSRELTCGLTEHTHTADCYSDPDADTETEDARMQSIPQDALTGDWAQDTVMIAASQMNYTESTRNWQLADDGTRRGYTRYGAWYGIPYGDWNGMFAAFCLHYAGVDNAYLTTDNAAGVNAWAVALYQAGQLQGTAHTAVPGDVVFLGSNDKIESCAIVADAADGTLTLIAGDVDNTVAELTLPADSSSILGYAATADAYAAYTADHPQNEQPEAEETAEDIPEDTEETADDNDTTDTAEPEADAAKPSFVTLEGTQADNAVTTPVLDDTTFGKSESVDLSGQFTKDNETLNYITSVKGGTANYENGLFKTVFDMGFQIPRAELWASGGKAYFDLPSGFKLTEELVNGGWRDSNDANAQYRFVKKEDGTYRIEIQFNEAYVKESQQDVISVRSLAFQAEAGQTIEKEDGDIVFSFTDNVTCTIPQNQIHYPSDETLNYDITTEKSGSFDLATKTLTYTAKISTTKGTPDEIDLTDVLTGLDALDVDSLTFTVKRNVDGTETTLTETTRTAGEDSKKPELNEDQYELVTKGADNKSFAMALPKLPKPADGTDKNYYTIEYKYTLANVPAGTNANANNKLNARSEDEKKNQVVVSEKNYGVTVKNEGVKKEGWADGNNSTIHWTITVNSSHADIAGKELTDNMFDRIKEGTLEIKAVDENWNQRTAEEAKDYTFTKDASGKITGIKFNDLGDGKNTYTYKIEYQTPYESSVDNQVIKNSAGFDGTKADADITIDGKGSMTKKADTSEIRLEPGTNTAVIPWTVTVNLTETGAAAGTQFEDEITCDSSNVPHYMTKDQAKALVAELDTVFADKGGYTDLFFKIGDTVYNSLESLPEDACVTKFVFKNEAALPKGTSFTLKYSTTVDASNLAAGGSTSAKNQARFGGLGTNIVGVKVSRNGAQKGVVQADLNKKLTSPDDTFMWFVKVNHAKDSTEQSYHIVDSLPEGVELVSVRVGLSADKNKLNANESQYWAVQGDGTLVQDTAKGPTNADAAKLTVNTSNANVTTAENGAQTVTLDVTASDEYTKSHDHFIVVYECKLTADEWSKAGTTAITKTNSVHVTKEGGLDYGTPGSTISVTVDKSSEVVKTLDKTAQWMGWNGSSGDMEYTLGINPEGKKLLPDGNGELTLIDTLHKDWNSTNGDSAYAYIELRTETVKLYKAKLVDGKLVEDGELDADLWKTTYEPENNFNKVLTVYLPDGMPLILKYTYRVTYTGNQMADSGSITFDNTAELKGVSNGSDVDNTTTKWTREESSMTVDNVFTFIKVDENDASHYLEGAVFRLWAYDADKESFVETDETFTTDKDGRFYVRWTDTKGSPRTPNRLYYVIEEEAPGVYELPEDPTKYYFYFSDTDETTYPLQKPADFNISTAVDLNKKSAVAFVTNEKLSTNIRIEKVWAEGTPADQAAKPVTVHVKSLAVPVNVWNAYYNQTSTLTVQSGGAQTQTVTYPLGTKVHVKYELDGYNNDVPDIKFIVDGQEIIPTHTRGENRHDTYEADITLTKESVVLEATPGYKGDNIHFTLPASSAVTDDVWNGSAVQSLDALKQKYSSTIEDRYTVQVTAGNPVNLYNLPFVKQKADENGQEELRYIYYVEEAPLANYESTVTVSGDNKAYSYTYTVTNTPNASYELPKTGGRGVVPYMAGGAVLMAVSLLCGLWKKRREGRRNS